MTLPHLFEHSKQKSKLNALQYASCLTALFALTPCINQAQASSWQGTLMAQSVVTYDSNPTMSTLNQEGVSKVSLNPSYALLGQFDDNELLKAGLALDLVRSSNESLSPNRNNPILFVDWTKQLETSELGLSSKYAESSTRSMTNLDATAPIETTRASRTLQLKANKSLSELSTISSNLSYESVTFDHSLFTDYSTKAADLSFTHSWGETYSTFAKVAHTEFATVNNNTQNKLDVASLGVNWKMSASLDSSLSAGQSRDDNNETGTQASATLKYQEQNSQLDLKASRQVMPSGISGFVTTEQVNGAWSYALNERNKTGIDAAWQKSYLATSTLLRTQGAWLQTELTPFWNIRMSYQYNMLDRGTGALATSHVVGLTLGYSNTDF